MKSPSSKRRRGGPTPSATPDDSDAAEAPRFHVFVIDSGWQSAAGQALRDNLATISRFADSCPIYVLNPEQSHALLAEDPDLIGKGPSLIVHDLHAKGGRGESGYHGFRLNLGVVHSREDAIRALQQFLHFTFTHRGCADIETAVRQRLHRDGLANAVEILHRTF